MPMTPAPRMVICWGGWVGGDMVVGGVVFGGTGRGFSFSA